MKKLICAIMAAAAGAAAAGVSFSYQGALKMADGEPIPEGERNKTIEFRLYEGPTDTGALWGCQTVVHLDENGLFNVELSDTTGTLLADVKTNKLDWVLASYLGSGKTLYIGLYVSGSTGEIRPRQQLLNVPAAAFAADVAHAKNAFTVDGIATFNGVANAKTNMTVEGSLTVGGSLTVPNGAIVPKGGIIMWNGSAEDVPDGWALCDGNNGTPDLRGRFIVGYDSANSSEYGVGKTGGEAAHKLGTSEIPSHFHTIYGVSSGGAVTRLIPEGLLSYSISFHSDDQRGRAGNLGTTGPVSVNCGQPHENRPPYYALCFIMKM